MANTFSLDLESGSSQYASITDASQTGLDLTTALTFEMWLKPESVPVADIYYFLSKAVSFPLNAAYQFYYDTQAADTRLYFANSDGAASDSLSVSQALTTATWQHIAVTWDGATKTAKFYYNGTQTGSSQVGTNVASIANTANPFIVGQKNTAGFYDGLVDEVRIWNTVRTQTEINNNKSVELVGNESGLVAYWKFNNDYLDETANNNDLTASGSPVFSSDVPFSGSSHAKLLLLGVG